MKIDLPIRQIAYFVPDARAAAARHSQMFGSGPYFVAEHIPLKRSFYRGREMPFDHTSAYGQWGGVMLEFVQQHNPDPSAMHDLYPYGSGRGGIHHVALWVDDLQASIKAHEDAGHALALYAEMNDGFAFAMMDASHETGHMFELYKPLPALTGFYEFVAKAAAKWDGQDPVRTIAFK